MKDHKLFSLKKIFKEVMKGHFHATNKLDNGETPIIGCGFENRGIEGYFDIPENKIYKNAVTIAGDGQPLTSFFHNYEFGAKDNVIICLPKEELSLSVLYYIIFIINKEKWRFSYGRKCYYRKMNKLKFPLPVNEKGEIDTEYIENNINIDFKKVTPQKNEIKDIDRKPHKFKEFTLSSVLDGLTSGDFHATKELDKGNIPLISCGENNNGLIDYFHVPSDSWYTNSLTIAYNGKPLTSKFHSYKMGAKDDVGVLEGGNLRPTTLIYIGAILNRMTWRFSYGRKCFKEKLKRQRFLLPIDEEGNLDENYIEETVTKRSYWEYLKEKINNTES